MNSSVKAACHEILAELKIPGIIKQYKRRDIECVNHQTGVAVNLTADIEYPAVAICERKIISVGKGATLEIAFARAERSNRGGIVFVFNKPIYGNTADAILKNYSGGIIIAPEIESGAANNLEDFTLIELNQNTDIKQTNWAPPMLKIHSLYAPDDNLLDILEFAWIVSCRSNCSVVSATTHRTIRMAYSNGTYPTLDFFSERERYEKLLVIASQNPFSREDIPLLMEMGANAIIQPDNRFDADVIMDADDNGLVMATARFQK